MNSARKKLKFMSLGVLTLSFLLAGAGIGQPRPSEEKQARPVGHIFFVELQDSVAGKAFEENYTGVASFDIVINKNEASVDFWFEPDTKLKSSDLESIGYYRYLKVEADSTDISSDLKKSGAVKSLEGPFEISKDGINLGKVIPDYQLGEILLRLKTGVSPEHFLAQNKDFMERIGGTELTPTYTPIGLPDHLSPRELDRRRKLRNLSKDRERDFVLRFSKSVDTDAILNYLTRSPEVESSTVNRFIFQQ